MNDAINALEWGSNGKLYVCLAIGAAIGVTVGFLVGSSGRVLFFVLCLIMIPLATAELATDAWIRSLMKPILGAKAAGWAIVLSAGIMMTLRFFAGIPLKVMSPPVLLLVSSLFSIAGLYAMSISGGWLIFVAFVLYAVGQTFYWPTMLGFVSEQFPRGGAMTLNTVSAMGLLTVGIFGFPFLGAVQDHYNTQTVINQEAEKFEMVKTDNVTYVDRTNPDALVDKPIYESKNFFWRRLRIRKPRGVCEIVVGRKTEKVERQLENYLSKQFKGRSRPAVDHGDRILPDHHLLRCQGWIQSHFFGGQAITLNLTKRTLRLTPKKNIHVCLYAGN